MTLHSLCLALLNHEITQALACGKRLSFSESKELLITFGALHLFVISGMHIHFLKKILNFFYLLKTKPWLMQWSLFTFLAACDFSAPLLRVFLNQALYTQIKERPLKVPKLFTLFLSYIFSLPICLLFNSLISLNLSFLFGLLIFVLAKTKGWAFFIKLYLLSLPLFLMVLGLPHFLSLAVSPLLSLIVGSLLMPLAFLSLLSELFEHMTVALWDQLNDFMIYFKIFFNFPEKPQVRTLNFNNTSLSLFNLSLLFFLSLGGVYWRRKSYSFSY